MTIWAAKAAFWENEIGSIEIGKQADFTIYKYNLLQPDKQSLPALKPISVWVAGEPLK
jgi:predicted amidohydrolase YtcJ